MVGVNKPVDSGRYLSKNNKIDSQWRFQLFIAFLICVSGVKFIGFYNGLFLSVGFITYWTHPDPINQVFLLFFVSYKSC